MLLLFGLPLTEDLFLVHVDVAVLISGSLILRRSSTFADQHFALESQIFVALDGMRAIDVSRLNLGRASERLALHVPGLGLHCLVATRSRVLPLDVYGFGFGVAGDVAAHCGCPPCDLAVRLVVGLVLVEMLGSARGRLILPVLHVRWLIGYLLIGRNVNAWLVVFLDLDQSLVVVLQMLRVCSIVRLGITAVRGPLLAMVHVVLDAAGLHGELALLEDFLRALILLSIAPHVLVSLAA